jgi:HEAT repeat protein
MIISYNHSSNQDQLKRGNIMIGSKRMSRGTLCLSGLIICGLGIFSDVEAARPKAEKQPPPDFTAGGKRDESHDWNLGATGARGWIYGWAGNTSEARQILVTAVHKGSPAENVLKINDVILGVAGKPFSGDARIQFANALTEAEKDANQGVLKLLRFRDGKSEAVELKLAVMGTYSETTPYNCPKSKKIFEQGCQAIAKKGLNGVSIPNNLNALALLASGNKEYLPMLAEYAKKASVYETDSMATWFYGYANMFLAEYVMATGDTSVMEGVKRMALVPAKGQSVMGLWGHKFARPDGNLNGYGAMNQPGISLSVSMVLARQAGVKDPELTQALDKSANFLKWFVNKGAIPYGDHQPWPGHEDNGKCSSAAVFFDLMGDADATAFYAKMSTAAYAERERGHTGNFFNLTWAMLGVARGGPLVTGAYMKEQAWLYDLARGWDGSFAYQGSPVGEEEHGKYTSWDSTGAYVLAYALPLKSLYITGKRPCVAPALNAKETAEVIAAGRDYNHAVSRDGYSGRTADQLLAGLSSWSPAVRKRSAQGLSRAEGDVLPSILKLLKGSSREARYGACEALAFLGPKADAAAPQLKALLKDTDPWMQSLACFAIAELSQETRKACVNDLLRMILTPNPEDPRHTAHRAAAVALFNPFPGSRMPRTSILSSGSLEGVDMALLRPVLQTVLQNEDSVARGSVVPILKKLNERELALLLPEIIKATEKLAPSNEMFADGIRLAGLDLLAQHHITEGLQLCMTVIEPDRWGSGRRYQPALASLSRYGSNARHLVPELQKMLAKLGKPKKAGEVDPNVAALEKAIADILADKNPPKLQTAAEFMAKNK